MRLTALATIALIAVSWQPAFGAIAICRGIQSKPRTDLGYHVKNIALARSGLAAQLARQEAKAKWKRATCISSGELRGGFFAVIVSESERRGRPLRVTYGFGFGATAEAARQGALKNLKNTYWSWKQKDGYKSVEVGRFGVSPAERKKACAILARYRDAFLPKRQDRLVKQQRALEDAIAVTENAIRSADIKSKLGMLRWMRRGTFVALFNSILDTGLSFVPGPNGASKLGKAADFVAKHATEINLGVDSAYSVAFKRDRDAAKDLMTNAWRLEGETAFDEAEDALKKTDATLSKSALSFVRSMANLAGAVSDVKTYADAYKDNNTTSDVLSEQAVLAFRRASTLMHRLKRKKYLLRVVREQKRQIDKDCGR